MIGGNNLAFIDEMNQIEKENKSLRLSCLPSNRNEYITVAKQYASKIANDIMKRIKSNAKAGKARSYRCTSFFGKTVFKEYFQIDVGICFIFDFSQDVFTVLKERYDYSGTEFHPEVQYNFLLNDKVIATCMISALCDILAQNNIFPITISSKTGWSERRTDVVKDRDIFGKFNSEYQFVIKHAHESCYSKGATFTKCFAYFKD